MMDESKDRDEIDGAVRVAHLVKHVSLFSYFDLRCHLITNLFKKSFVLLTPRVQKNMAHSPPTCKAFTVNQVDTLKYLS